MNIVEAVEKAMKEGRCITIEAFNGKAKIKPTNENGNCIVMNADGHQPSRFGWQPTADDLLREDWEVVD